MDTNRHKESIRVFEKLLKITPENKNALHMIGKSYYQIGRDLWIGRNLGRGPKLSEMRRNYQQSLIAFKESLHDNPSTHFEKNHNVVGYYFMGKISRFLGQIGDAITYVHSGLELQPNNFRLLEFAENLSELSKRRSQR